MKNEDGTFNITSKLRLQPSSQDNGNIYSCIVEHKSFPKNLLPSVELLVTGMPFMALSLSLCIMMLQTASGNHSNKCHTWDITL